MITTRLQTFTHRHQARLLSSGRLLVRCAPRKPLLVGSYEKFFRVFKLNVVGMHGRCHRWRSPNPINGEGEVEGVDGDPPLQIDGKSEFEDVDGDPFGPKCWRRQSP